MSVNNIRFNMSMPWREEPNEVSFKSFGYHCEIKRHKASGTLRGYIRIQKDHPWFIDSIDELNRIICAHGGINHLYKKRTFAVIGFKCDHPEYDFIPMRPDLSSVHSLYKTVEFVKDEIAYIAEQAKNAKLRQQGVHV